MPRGFSEEDIARWMSTVPARMAGLAPGKGEIVPGYDADFVIWDPDEEFTVDANALHHRHKLTPYAGRRLRGSVKKTYLRGHQVFPGEQPRGRILKSRWA